MGKIVKSIVTVAAFAALTVATGGANAAFLGIKSIGLAALAGGAIGAGLGVLSTVLAPKPQQMDEQAGVKQPIYNPADTRKIIYGQQRVSGTEVFIEEYDDNHNNDIPNDRLVLAHVVADHPVTSFDQFWLGDEKINFAADKDQHGAGTGNAITGKYANKLHLRVHNGTQMQHDGRLVETGTEWTPDHIGYGVAYFTLKASFDQEVFPYNADSLRRCSIDIKGKPVYDPRKAGHDINDPATWEYSTNPALCIYDYLRDDVLGNPVPDVEINTDSIIAAANICDEDIMVVGGDTIKRYTLNGVVDSSRDKFSNVQTMLTAMGGRIMWLGGEIHIFAASERTGTHLLDEDVILSAQYDPLPPAESRYNEVRGTFISPDDHYETQDYPPLIDHAEQAAEGERALSLNLPYTQDHRIAQRLAKIALYNSRQSILRIEALPAAAAFAPMDVVSVSWDNFGLAGEDFRILDQSINGGSGDRPMTVTLTMVREEGSAYAWDISDEQPRGEKPALAVIDPSLAPAPTGVIVTSETLTSLDGTKTTSLLVTWDEPLPTVTLTTVDYRVVGDSVWLPGGSSIRRDTDLRLLLPPAQTYEVQVRHEYASGLVSAPIQPSSTSTEALEGADRLVHRGEYSGSTPYKVGEVVNHDGSSYLCIADTTGNAPPNPTYWSLLAQVGGYRDIRFRRSASQPSTPSGTNPSGWSDGPPAANGNPLWMSTVLRAADDSLIGNWTTPQEVGGSGLNVQYSANGSSWHNTFLASDIYMRQQLSGGSWSSAIRIVGEQGVAGATGATGPQGPQGIAGPTGASGQTLYLWIGYADNASGNNMTTGLPRPTDSYFGTAPNKTTPVESTNGSLYTWKKMPSGMTEQEIVDQLGWTSSTVQTENIAAHAVTRLDAYEGSSIQLNDGPSASWKEVASVNTSGSSGDEVLIMFTGIAYDLSPNEAEYMNVEVRLKENAIVRLTRTVAAAGGVEDTISIPATFFQKRTLPASSTTYAVEARDVGSSTGNTYMAEPTIAVLKRLR